MSRPSVVQGGHQSGQDGQVHVEPNTGPYARQGEQGCSVTTMTKSTSASLNRVSRASKSKGLRRCRLAQGRS
jgi:hypothetical protein